MNTVTNITSLIPLLSHLEEEIEDLPNEESASIKRTLNKLQPLLSLKEDAKIHLKLHKKISYIKKLSSTLPLNLNVGQSFFFT
jgi:transcription initiation factor TFIIIB Brf1 subunit/transcription initiation factor TFIIB